MKKNETDFEKLERIEKAYKLLLMRCYELEEEVKNLKSDIEKAPIRTLLPDIDESVADYLFNVDVDPNTGELISATLEKRNCNFTNFYRYISQTFKPTAVINTGQKDKFLLKWSCLNDMSEKEYRIFRELIFDIVQLIYTAKVEANTDICEEETKCQLK